MLYIIGHEQLFYSFAKKAEIESRIHNPQIEELLKWLETNAYTPQCLNGKSYFHAKIFKFDDGSPKKHVFATFFYRNNVYAAHCFSTC